jgi:mRNA-degrading endonuclease RelE of RelBE toxin-antitoxin system
VARVDLSSSAQKDLAKLLKTAVGAEIKRVVMEELTAEPWPDNLDVVSLEGKGTWLRVRVGTFRIVLRPMTAAECTTRDVEKGYLVDRVLNRRDLERVLKAYR